MNILVRCMLFLCSYFPLFAILFVLLGEEQPLLAWSFLGVGLLGLAVSYVYFKKVAFKRSPLRGDITSKNARGGEIMAYIASYIVPFVSFSLGSLRQIIALIIFILILGIIYISSEDMVRVNPMFNLLGYRLYEVTVEQGKDSFALITRRRITSGDRVLLIKVDNGIFWEKK
jgi:hypothetical protein